MNVAQKSQTMSKDDVKESSPAPAPAAARPTFTLYDRFALAHFDVSHSPIVLVKKKVDAKTVGYALHRAWQQSRTPGPLQSHGRDLIEFAETTLNASLQELVSQVAEIKALCDSDPLVGDPPAVPGTTVEVMWEDRRFWVLVRMTMALDDGNRRLLHLHQRGAIDKDDMKRRQREFARPYRSALLQILEFAGREKTLKTTDNKS